MSLDQHPLSLVLQTVRLPSGTDQFVVPQGSQITRGELQKQLDGEVVDAAHSVVQPETGRQGTERLIALQVDALTAPEKTAIRETLHQWLTDIPSVIDEASQSLASSSGGLPISRKLTGWQTELNRHCHSEKTTQAVPAANENRSKGVFAMVSIGLLVAATLVLIPQFLQGKRTSNSPSGDSVEVSEKWNLTRSADFKGESDLIKLLEPLIVVNTEAGSEGSSQSLTDSSALARLLDQINRARLGEPFDASKEDNAAGVSKLNTLLADDSLRSDLDRLILDDGTFDRFGLINDQSQNRCLLLLPKNIDDQTAIRFRRLALQLVGATPIGETGKRITELDKPFTDLADDDSDLSSFEALKEGVPRTFRQANSHATFFTRDDEAAAKQIVLYLIDIGFLADGKLGFPEQKQKLCEAYADLNERPSHAFASLLLRWKAFVEGSRQDQHNIQHNNDN